ncbi:C40 family peptidase [Paenibacillus sp.]|uniref:C40 family peptidase n=1 Tax=Paenibacillus sp. TaxID=58172 RepID=UPI002D6B1601|nr:C40 family peptidase [Paenibacillus sp.]HZG58467.1 C40 family peptidase [Paenibacillus sp.]
MKARLWKTTATVLTVALTVTACGAGAGGGNVGTRSAEQPRTGDQSLVERARQWGTVGDVGHNHIPDAMHRAAGDGESGTAGAVAARGEDGRLLIGADGSLPFPWDAVRPLDERPAAGGGTGRGMGMLQQRSAQQEPIKVPYVMEGGERYVPVDTLVDVLQYEHYVTESEAVREIGDKDVIFRLVAGSVEAEKEGNPFKLASAPKLIGGKLMLTATAAADLFAEEMVFDAGEDGLLLYPTDTDVQGRDTDGGADERVDPSLDFGDDPNDPFKGDDAEGAFGSAEEADAAIEALEAMAADPEAVPALKNININAMIRTAKKYIGVKYRFGAGPYPRTNRFDCSSYTRYVFDKYGIDLPRTARAQARVGKTVSRKSLRKGDLLFFYVPGRFKSNKTIGHVGIYIGNRMMIHANTEPKNGVQLRSIDTSYWKKTFIKAKRIAY